MTQIKMECISLHSIFLSFVPNEGFERRGKWKFLRFFFVVTFFLYICNAQSKWARRHLPSRWNRLPMPRYELPRSTCKGVEDGGGDRRLKSLRSNTFNLWQHFGLYPILITVRSVRQKSTVVNVFCPGCGKKLEHYDFEE